MPSMIKIFNKLQNLKEIKFKSMPRISNIFPASNKHLRLQCFIAHVWNLVLQILLVLAAACLTAYECDTTCFVLFADHCLIMLIPMMTKTLFPDQYWTLHLPKKNSNFLTLPFLTQLSKNLLIITVYY